MGGGRGNAETQDAAQAHTHATHLKLAHMAAGGKGGGRVLVFTAEREGFMHGEGGGEEERGT